MVDLQIMCTLLWHTLYPKNTSKSTLLLQLSFSLLLFLSLSSFFKHLSCSQLLSLSLHIFSSLPPFSFSISPSFLLSLISLSLSLSDIHSDYISLALTLFLSFSLSLSFSLCMCVFTLKSMNYAFLCEYICES